MSAIKAGDLVMVVRPTLCCANTGGLGTVYRVAEVSECPSVCCTCADVATQLMVWGHDDLGCHVSRVIRLDPLPEPEHTETEREVTA